MKYDLSKPLTRGVRRTLDALSGAMFLLLSEKSFEEITAFSCMTVFWKALYRS